ncbi:MAG: hypothetical protein IMZ61_07145 [Planctomycetes bacterium]|nr:hypothetical protein [Planctomycetota bacterium]
MSNDIEIKIIARDEASVSLKKLQNELVVLQQRIDKAVKNHEKVSDLRKQFTETAAAVEKAAAAYKKAADNLEKVNLNLRQIGEKMGNVGRSMSMFFTVPILGMVAGLTKLGSTASKTVNELKGNITKAAQDVTNAQIDLNNAIIGGNEDQVRSAMETLAAAKSAYAGTLVAMDNTSLGVKRAAAAYDALQASLAPIKYKLDEIWATLLESFIPVLKDMIPAIGDVVTKIGNAVTWFANLDAGSKNLVFGFGAVLFAAGPVLVIFGNIIRTVAALNQLIPFLTTEMWALAPAVWASVGPFALLAGSIAFLGKVIYDNWDLLLKFGKLFGFSLTGVAPTNVGLRNDKTPGLFEVTQYLPGKALGGRVFEGRGYMVGENGAEPFFPDQNGTILPHGSGAGGVAIYLTYAPTVGLASQLEAETKLAPYIKAALRKAGYPSHG